jgi:hypothetical protein
MADVPVAAPAAPAAPASPSSSTPTPTSSAPAASGAPSPGAHAESKAPATAEEFFDLVIDGKTEKLTRQQLITRAQKGTAAEKRFRESAEMTKKNQQLLEMLTKDPEAALSELQIDLDALAEKRLLKKFEESQMSEEQRRIRELETKARDLETREQQRQRQAEEAKRAEQEKFYMNQLESNVIDAAKKGGLPQDPETLVELLKIGQELAEYEIPHSPEHLVSEFRERQAKREAEASKRWTDKLSKLDGDALLDAIDKGLLQRVLRAFSARAKGLTSPPAATTPTTPEPAEEKRADPSAFFKSLKFTR